MEATPIENNGVLAVSIEMSNLGSTTVSSPSFNQSNYEEFDRLYYAAANGDINKFNNDLDSLDQLLTPNGNTILHIHITARELTRRRNTELSEDDFVRYMIRNCPALLCKKNNKGETLLHIAARHGHADVARFLLCKCSVDNGITAKEMLEMTSNEAKDTALHEAARCNHLDVVRVLATEDASLVYEANSSGETPLYIATMRGYIGIVREILQTCYTPADQGSLGRTALHAAVIRNDLDLFRLLINDSRICKSKQDDKGWTPLHFAAHLGKVYKLMHLLSKDTSAAYKADNEGKTALHIAAGLGKVKIMKELMSKCPNCCELVDHRGWNVLHFAASRKTNRKAVNAILENPSLANLINEKDENGNTPFLLGHFSGIVLDHVRADKFAVNNRNENCQTILRDHNVVLNTSLEWFKWIRMFYSFDLKWGGISILRFQGIHNPQDEDRRLGEENDNSENSRIRYGDLKSQHRNRDDLFVKARQNELVAATLIVTVTFAAGLTLPGGFIQQGKNEGTAVLTKNRAFRAFVILNSISMFLSILAVFTHLPKWPYDVNKASYKQMKLGRAFLVLALRALFGAFLSGSVAVLYPDRELAVSTCVVPLGVFISIRVARFLGWIF